MISSSNRLLASKTMSLDGTNNAINLWDDSFKAASSQQAGFSTSARESAKNDHMRGKTSDQEADVLGDKASRRLAQNREAARKSRLKKKAYIQQLESTRAKLAKVENDLENAKQKGIYKGIHFGDSASSSSTNSDLVAFEMEYGRWVEEQNKYRCELRAALQAHVSEIELRILVETVMRHYDELFRIKSAAAKAEVLTRQLEPLTEQQMMAVENLQQSAQQAEDALSQGIDRLQKNLALSLSNHSLGSFASEDFADPIAAGVGKLGSLVDFVIQADNLRQQILQQLHRILTVRQAARGLLALGDYFQRLRALSSLWAARPRQDTN